MADEFDLLDKCNAPLPVARVVDRIIYTRLAKLQITREGRTEDAIYPPDRAYPERVVTRPHGWPPDDLVKARGGLPLDELWDPVPEEAKARPAVTVQVGDVDDFIANPTIDADGGRVRLDLAAEHVTLLANRGSAIVPGPEGQTYVIEAASGFGPVTHAQQTRELAVSDVASVAAEGGLRIDGRHIALSGAELRTLRSGAAITVTPRIGAAPVRVIPAPTISSAISPLSLSLNNGGTGFSGPGITRSEVVGTTELYKAGTQQKPVPTEDPLPKLQFCVQTSYSQTWTLAGFARGDLINSIGLAPQEETTIDIFSWDRHRRSTEDTTEESTEQSLESGWTQRLTRDVVRDLTLTEVARLTQAGVSIPIENQTVGLNVGGDFGSQLVSVGKDSASWVGEATAKAAARTRGMRQTKIAENQEWGTETRTTRRLRNQNLARTITYDLFEMLAAYDVATAIDPSETRLCVLVPAPFPVKLFDRLVLLTYEAALRRSLLDRYQEDGFAAARWLAAREEYRRLEALRPKDPTPGSTGSTSAPAAAPAAPTPVSPDAALRAGDAVVAAIIALRDANHRIASMYDNNVRGADLEPYILEFRRWLFRRFPLTMSQPAFWSACTDFATRWTGSGRSVDNLANFLVQISGAWAEVAGRVALTLIFPPAITFIVGAIMEEYLRELGTKSLWYMQYWGFDDAGLGAALETARTEVSTYKKSILSGSNLPPAEPPKQPDAPTTSASKAEPAPDRYSDADAAERIVAERALLGHLEANRSHYIEAIWQAFSPVDQSRLVALACGQLSQDIIPEVLGFEGASMIVPFDLASYPESRKVFETSIAHLLKNAPAPIVRRVVLPTPGIQLEARLGRCDAVEPYVSDMRDIDLDDRRARARQAEYEAKRMLARLEADPPALDNPLQTTAGLTVRVENGNGNGPTP